MNQDLWVVVYQNDKVHPRWGADTNGPIVFETYLSRCTRELAQARAASLEIHGACRLARLVFEGDPVAPMTRVEIIAAATAMGMAFPAGLEPIDIALPL